MASTSGTLYIGVTNNLIRRVIEHKKGLIEGFSKKYLCKKLVYFERYDEMEYAIKREKQIKKWCRDKKEKLICAFNVLWADLYDDLFR